MSGLAKLNKPWLHFIVLGVAFYQLQSMLVPEPKAVINPLSEARIETLKSQWQSSTGRPPSEEQLSDYISAELDRDMLVQSALDLELHLVDSIVHQRLIRNMQFLQLAVGKSDVELFDQAIEMRLHLDDEVVRRRLIQMMEQRLLVKYPARQLSEEEIQTAFESRKDDLRRPPMYTFEHVFFSEDRVSTALAVISRISEEGLGIKEARKLGSPFLQGLRFQNQTPDQLSRSFGKHFVEGLEQVTGDIETPMWLGPVPSAYGIHYVWLSGYEPARDVELEEVRQQLLQDLAYVESKRALRCAIANHRSEFVIPDVKSREEEGCE